MHARPDGSLPPSPRWMNDDPYRVVRRAAGLRCGERRIWLDQRRQQLVERLDTLEPSSPRGCANGATRSTRPRRSTTASGRPSRPGGVGVHLVPVGRRWHRRWWIRIRSAARRCARSAVRCCTVTESWLWSNCTRSSTCTATRSSAGRRSRPLPTASATRRSKGGRSGFGGASTGCGDQRHPPSIPGWPAPRRAGSPPLRPGSGASRSQTAVTTGLRVKPDGLGVVDRGAGDSGGVDGRETSRPPPCTHSGSGPSRGRPVKNLAAMHPPWQAS